MFLKTMQAIYKLSISDLIPYIKIMRLDKRVGIWLLVWPCLWSITIASGAPFEKDTLILMLKFIIGAIVMRSAGCVINDIVDHKIDKQVERTKTRPLANNEMSLRSAMLFATLLMLIGLYILLSLNKSTIILGLIIVIPIILYPFMKRITYWPQVFLGFTFNWGALMGWSAVMDGINFSTIILYVACILWTIGYDTIYAHQDKQDDALLGLASTALKFGSKTKQYLIYLYGIATILLWTVGIFNDIGIMFHVSLLIGGAHFIWQIYTLDINNSGNCMKRFLSNKTYGAIIFAGLVLGTADF